MKYSYILACLFFTQALVANTNQPPKIVNNNNAVNLGSIKDEINSVTTEGTNKIVSSVVVKDSDATISIKSVETKITGINDKSAITGNILIFGDKKVEFTEDLALALNAEKNQQKVKSISNIYLEKNNVNSKHLKINLNSDTDSDNLAGVLNANMDATNVFKADSVDIDVKSKNNNGTIAGLFSMYSYFDIGDNSKIKVAIEETKSQKTAGILIDGGSDSNKNHNFGNNLNIEVTGDFDKIGELGGIFLNANHSANNIVKVGDNAKIKVAGGQSTYGLMIKGKKQQQQQQQQQQLETQVTIGANTHIQHGQSSKQHTGEGSIGVYLQNKGELETQGDLIIQTFGDDVRESYGIKVNSGNYISNANINGNLIINQTANRARGIYSHSGNSAVKVSGDATIKTFSTDSGKNGFAYAIEADSNAQINIDGKADITGDIVAVGIDSDTADSKVTLGKNSIVNGDLKILVSQNCSNNGNYTCTDKGNISKEDKVKLSLILGSNSILQGASKVGETNKKGTINLTLDDSTWKLTETSEVSTLKVSNDTKIYLHSDISKDNSPTKLTINELQGDDATFIMSLKGYAANNQGQRDETKSKADYLTIKNSKEADGQAYSGDKAHPKIKLTKDSLNLLINNNWALIKAIDLADVDKDSNDPKVELVNGNLNDYKLDSKLDNKILKIKGLVPVGVSLTGQIYIDYAKSLYQSLPRLEIDSIHKRLGAIDGEIYKNSGFWVRNAAGRLRDASRQQSDFYTMLQVGSDYAIDDALYGFAFDFKNNSFKFKQQATAASKHYGFSLYRSQILDDGLYFDVVSKFSLIKNKFNFDNLESHFKTNSIAVSTEIGKKFDLGTFFFTPNTRLTYSHVKAFDYDDTRVKARNSSIDSYIGRVGFDLGLNLQGQSHFIKLGLLREFNGKYQVDYKSITSETSTYKHKSTDVWSEIGIGGDININKSANFYYEIEKTFNSYYDKTWQTNLGFRVKF